jgi:hypothetical protein
VIMVLEAAAATHSDESRIPSLGEDHQLPISLLCPPRVTGSVSDEPASYRRLASKRLWTHDPAGPAVTGQSRRLGVQCR